MARRANVFSLDDSNTNSPYTGGSNLTPNADSVEEVRVVSNNFSATEGRSTGARVQMTSKAGTNTVHGGASYYFQNNTLSSRTVFETNGVPVFRRNQFGYFVGGPIIRNRTFFFTYYEGLRSSGARSSVITVETPAFRDWVKQALPNSIAAKILTNFPSTAIPTSNFVSLAANPSLVSPPAGLQAYGNGTFTPDSHRYGDQFSVRLDHEIRPGKDKFFGNFYRTRNTSLDGSSRPAFNRERFEHALFWSVNETHIFSGNKLNEFKYSTMRYEGQARAASASGSPEHLRGAARGLGRFQLAAGVVAVRPELYRHIFLDTQQPLDQDRWVGAAVSYRKHQHQQLHS